MAWFGFAVLLGLSMLFIGQAIYESYIRARLRKKQILVEGLITDIASADRNGQSRVTYRYEYDAKTYERQQMVNQETAQAYRDNPEKDVTVSCLLEHPSISRLPAGPVYGRTAMFAITCLIGAAIFAYVAFTSPQ